jgi:hypothetical protein
MKTDSANKAGIVSRYRHFIFFVIKDFSFTKMLKNAQLIFMTIIKLFVALCLKNSGGSSLKMAITPIHVGAN